MQNAETLLRTKLHPPFIRQEQVNRPRLQSQVASGLRQPLTLITAPAGFGKTTLVAGVTSNCGMAVAWLSLDKDDNREERFMSYVVAALREAVPTFVTETLELLNSSPQHPIEKILTSLINDLDTIDTDIVLVLDDYQSISNPAIHEAITFFIDHTPSAFHLVIATRSDPPLPLTRLRARGQMVELRAVDLRFTTFEATQFLNEVMGLSLDQQSVAILEERTEGWIAGLQMAALSMRDRKDVLSFIEGFSGTNRYILDYLLDEVLASQLPEIQHFLLCTSILDRLTAPLCDAILRINETLQYQEPQFPRLAFQTIPQVTIMLEYLERANLFLVPLDDERVWYRYHQLFADLLNAQLHKIYGEKEVALLHLLAAGWYEQNGFIMDAIQHASLASDDEMVERFIDRHYMDMVNRGEMSWVRSWTGQLSKESVQKRPWLCLYEALSHSWFGKLQEAMQFLEEAEKHMPGECITPEAKAMMGYHAYVKSRVTAMQGDTRQAIAFCLMAREHIPVENLALQHDVSITLGYEYFLYGDFNEADKVLRETIRTGLKTQAVNNPVAAYALLARIQVYQGQLHDANQLLQKAAQLIKEVEGQHLGAVGLVEVGMAAILYEWNDLETAFNRLMQGLECLPYWGKSDDICLAYVILSRIFLAQKNLPNAMEAVEKASQLVESCGLFSEARYAVQAAQVRIWLERNDWVPIHSWRDEICNRLTVQDPIQFEDELARIAYVRILIALGEENEAIQLLASLEETARAHGRLGRLIEILNLKAIAWQKNGENSQATTALSESLALAAPGEYIRIFLDEGQILQDLLAQWLARSGAYHLKDYASRLYSYFRSEFAEAMPDKAMMSSACFSAETEVCSANENLIEPLTQRELEVLNLLALGKTNQQIAQQLVVSRGTIKAHTASIYRKLDASNRTEAVAQARQLKIIL